MEPAVNVASLKSLRRAVVSGSVFGGVYTLYLFLMFALAFDPGPTGGIANHLRAILASGAIHLVVVTVCWWIAFRRPRPPPIRIIVGAATAALLAPVLTLAFMAATGFGMAWFPEGFRLARETTLSPGIGLSLFSAILGGLLALREEGPAPDPARPPADPSREIQAQEPI
jgi:hypothetical protein